MSNDNPPTDDVFPWTFMGHPIYLNPTYEQAKQFVSHLARYRIGRREAIERVEQGIEFVKPQLQPLLLDTVIDAIDATFILAGDPTVSKPLGILNARKSC